MAAVLLLAAGCGGEGDADEAARTTTAAAEAQSPQPFGKYERRVTQADLDRNDSKRTKGWETPPPGAYRLTLDRGVMQVVDPNGLYIAQELTVDGDTLRIERYIGESGIAFCPNDGPSSYNWELDGETLSLSPEDDACPDRDSILTGSWSKTG
jgi:hypothetical protein